MFKDVLPILQVQDLVWLAGVISAGMASLVQKFSKTYKPWNWLAEQIGKAINKPVLDELQLQREEINNLKKRDERQDAQKALDDAVDARRRILRFADECRRGLKHSQEYFNDVLQDITDYELYCDEHPKFKNEKAVEAIELLREVYKQCMRTNDFL